MKPVGKILSILIPTSFGLLAGGLFYANPLQQWIGIAGMLVSAFAGYHYYEEDFYERYDIYD